ncbi:MAG: hypothetical protein ABS95_00940 [Verrucomicrobia bacterium SCN 57-15]|nr:MAG: hypothetical protein ABS95_00940 [Verrucomicrobia bacterium SCN 57-15]
MKELAENDEPLRQLLREWVVDITLPPRFQEQVWRRIARREEEAKPSLRQAFMHWLETTFNRPALAVSYVAILLIAGLTTGYVQAQDKSARAESQWRTLYVQSVDPYQAPRN